MEGVYYVRLWEGALSKCKLDSMDSELGLTYNFRKHDKKASGIHKPGKGTEHLRDYKHLTDDPDLYT